MTSTEGEEAVRAYAAGLSADELRTVVVESDVLIVYLSEEVAALRASLDAALRRKRRKV